MELLQPWKTTIGKLSVLDFVDIDAMLNEVMQHPAVMEKPVNGSLRVKYEEFPICSDVLEHKLKPQVERYISTVTTHTPKRLSWSSWFHICMHGNGLIPHYHDEALNSVLYLTTSKANLVLRDPLASQARQWPQEMRKVIHADQQFHPVKGDFVIFPGYVDHYVMSDEPDFRISMATDWIFR